MSSKTSGFGPKSVSVTTSSLFGGTKGTYFDDNDDIGQVEFCSDEMCSIDIDRPIKQIVVRYGGVIDGISVVYNVKGGNSNTVTKDHGTTSNDNPGLKHDKIDITDDEEIIAIVGKAGKDNKWGERVCALEFVIWNRNLAKLKTYGPYGGTGGDSFRFAANGSFIGFAGRSKDTPSNIGQQPDGGLFGLMFIDANYRKV